jgi:hypothetical protein
MRHIFIISAIKNPIAIMYSGVIKHPIPRLSIGIIKESIVSIIFLILCMGICNFVNRYTTDNAHRKKNQIQVH